MGSIMGPLSLLPSPSPSPTPASSHLNESSFKDFLMRLKNTKSYLSIPTLIAKNFIFDPKIDDMYKCKLLSCKAFEINAALFLLTMTTLGC